MAGEYFHHRKRYNKLKTDYFSCPMVCAIDSKKKRYDSSRPFCDECKVKALNTTFKNEVLQFWSIRLGELEAKKFNFEQMLSTLYFVKNCEDKPIDKISVYVEGILNVYLDEKWKFESDESN